MANRQNHLNPGSNPILQALLDVADSGHGSLTISDAITRIRSDKHLAADLKAKWDGHSYPERSIKWAKLHKSQQLMTLSDTALKVLIFMGMYAHQSTLLQVSYKDLVIFTGVKDRSLRNAIRELTDCGCIRVERPSARHAAPIYAVNPAIATKGKSSKAQLSDFTSKIGDCPDYILKRDPKIIVVQETVYQETPDGEKITYNRLRPELAPKTEAPETHSAPQVPGQMTVYDYPELLPGGEDRDQGFQQYVKAVNGDG